MEGERRPFSDEENRSFVLSVVIHSEKSIKTDWKNVFTTYGEIEPKERSEKVLRNHCKIVKKENRDWYLLYQEMNNLIRLQIQKNQQDDVDDEDVLIVKLVMIHSKIVKSNDATGQQRLDTDWDKVHKTKERKEKKNEITGTRLKTPQELKDRFDSLKSAEDDKVALYHAIDEFITKEIKATCDENTTPTVAAQDENTAEDDALSESVSELQIASCKQGSRNGTT